MPPRAVLKFPELRRLPAKRFRPRRRRRTHRPGLQWERSGTTRGRRLCCGDASPGSEEETGRSALIAKGTESEFQQRGAIGGSRSGCFWSQQLWGAQLGNELPWAPSFHPIPTPFFLPLFAQVGHSIRWERLEKWAVGERQGKVWGQSGVGLIGETDLWPSQIGSNCFP